MKKLIVLILTLFVVLTGCRTSEKDTLTQVTAVAPETQVTAVALNTTTETAIVEETKKRIDVLKLEIQALANNKLGHPLTKTIRVYLPSSYYTSDKNYPVVYFLHGFSGKPGELIQSEKQADSAFQGENDKEFIIVEPEGDNPLSGSFYVNSLATGNYEDYIVQELIQLIDSKYRTIPSPQSRGIAGFSMGGFGAFNLALKHPDTYSCMFALAPGVFDANGLNDALDSWKSDTGFKIAYGMAFSPDLSGPKPKAEIPKLDGTASDNEIIQKWESGFGQVDQKIEAYLKLKTPLNKIKIMVGKNDYYGWIKTGSQYLSEQFTKNGIENSFETFNGNHEITPQFLDKYFIPFFSENLVFE